MIGVHLNKRKPMRICVTGSHGVGKTTLCVALGKALARLGQVGFVPETARQLVARGFAVNDDMSAEGVDAYVSIYNANLKAAVGDFVLSDRCLLDMFVYTESLYHPSGRLGDKLGKRVWELVKNDATQIDLFVHIPIEFPMTHDGVRPSDIEFQLHIDSRIKNTLDRLSANYIFASGPMEKRLSAVVKAVEELSCRV